MNRLRVFGVIACMGLVAPFAGAQDASCAKCGAGQACGSCSADGATNAAGKTDTANKVCPFSGDPVDASAETVSFKGKKVGFCCSDCAGKFEALNDTKKEEYFGKAMEASFKQPAKADKACNTVCPFSGDPVDASAETVSFKGKKVGFCCSDCAGKFEAMNDTKKEEYFGKAIAASFNQPAATDKPINAMCPVGKEAIDPEVETISYKGKTIGFCCDGCSEKFLAWDEAKKDAFVAEAAMTSGKMSHDGMKGMAKPAAWTGPYTLNTCPVSGEELGGDMGDPIVKVIDGREVRFCCEKCVGKFEANKAEYFKKIDRQIMHDQMRYYPTQTCLLSGEALVEDGEDISNNFVYGNRLIRTCCKKCERKFKADPAAYIKQLDKAAADAQREHYPLKTCPVSGEELGGMGEPKEIVVAGRLIKLCCGMCEPKVRANPGKYVAMVDAAWQAQGMYMPGKGEHEEHAAHSDHDESHEADHDEHGGHDRDGDGNHGG